MSLLGSEFATCARLNPVEMKLRDSICKYRQPRKGVFCESYLGNLHRIKESAFYNNIKTVGRGAVRELHNVEFDILRCSEVFYLFLSFTYFIFSHVDFCVRL